MDNITTGSFIKELRKEKNMTQKQLADLLHITDRAVSKWERGVCAPDISLLEPLAEILEVSIVELIQGERAEAPQEAEASAKEIISYSQNEVRRKVRGVQKKYLLIAALVLALAALIGGVLLWRSGRLFILDEVFSPDGTCRTTVYSKRLKSPLLRNRKTAYSGESSTEIVPIRAFGGRRTAESTFWLWTMMMKTA